MNKLPPKGSRQKQICQTYAALARKLKRYPTRVDLKKAGISRDSLRAHFGNLEELQAASKKQYPSHFEGLIDTELFTPANFRKIQDQANTYTRFVITTAVQGCKVHKKFLRSLRAYCEANNALLLVMLCKDPAAKTGDTIDPALQKDVIVYDNLALNSNIFASPIKLSAKHIDPITGLARIGQRNGSFIYASPKQRMQPVATSSTKHPVVLMTTGACTIPSYKSDRYLSDRTAVIADTDHVIGAIVVEVESDRYFHYRQLQGDKKGKLIDLAVMFDGAESREVRPEALVLGDWHSGSTSPTAKAAAFEQIRLLKPRFVVIHDGFDGRAISHHEEKNKILRAKRAMANQLSLEQELRGYANDLNELVEICEDVEQIVIVKSNHDEHLDRYLADARYVEDAINHHLALKLASGMIEGKDPVRTGVEMLGLKYPDRIRWLSRDEDFKVARIELGAHGDKGANGARGSLQAMENAYGTSVSGHAHTPAILRGAWQVGTMSHLKLSYTQGASSWMNTNCVVYKNGMRQLLNIINGRWKL